ncbi:MAG TPA: hypothetical protein PKH69_12935 [Thiobacillaceae bacterium]|nr:hypothetical protein [Thiobacillaceae bacterium]HNU65433.1 hypothetical protein [Thiobacillaceae bacterium]
MSPRHRFLPPPPRFFPGQRWVNIGLRCAHLLGIAGIGGGFLSNLPETQWLPFWHLALASGGLLALLYVWTDAAWLLQLKGQVILLKVVLLVLAARFPAWRAEAFSLVIVLSGFFSHATSRVRGYAWGRKVRACGSAVVVEPRR